ncbi:DUF759 family protein, partial [Borreliella garinii]|uniref:DUF759 family protein n=1 Tax=Borreliella garinii TaxID=29519 RepID=UPI00226D1928
NLQKNQKQKVNSQGKGLVAKIAIDSTLGTVIGNAVSRVSDGILALHLAGLKNQLKQFLNRKKCNTSIAHFI